MGKLEVYDSSGALKVTAPEAEPVFHGIRVWMDANESIATGVEENISVSSTWTLDFDTDSFLNTPTLGTFTVPAEFDNYYVRLTAQVRWDNQAAGYRRLMVKRNSTDDLAANWLGAQSTVFHCQTSVIIVAQAGDNYAVFVEQNRGGATDVEASGTAHTFFELEVLGPVT